MGDVDNAHAPVPQHVDDAEQMLHFLLGEGGGGLVEDNDFGVVGNSLGDFHHLPLRDGHGTHDPVRIYVDVQLLEDGHGVLIHFALIDGNAADGGVAAQPDVVHNTALQSLIQLLMHHGHAIFQCFFGAFEVNFFPIQINMSVVLVVNSEQTLHQGRLTGAVLAHQCVNSTALKLQTDMIQSLDAWEGFGDILHFQQNILLHTAFLPYLFFRGVTRRAIGNGRPRSCIGERNLPLPTRLR